MPTVDFPAAVASRTAEYIAQCLRVTLGYAEKLVADIAPERFAFSPHAAMNHPAFCIGHLSLYPNRVFMIVGMPELVVERKGFAELFQAGSPCLSDFERYPSKQELMDYYRERYAKAGEVLPSLSDDVFQRLNPLEGRMRDMFPLVGTAVNFLLVGHHMVHLGQISAWRRAAGIGPAM